MTFVIPALEQPIIDAYNLRQKYHDEAVAAAMEGNANKAAYLNWCAEDLAPRAFAKSFPGLTVGVE